MSDTPETDALESQLRDDHFTPLHMEASLYRDLARELERRLTKLKSTNLLSIEFIRFLNARKGWHGNQYRTACGQWLSGKIKANPAETQRFWKPAFHEGANMHCCDAVESDRAICGMEINTTTVIPTPKYTECCWNCMAKLTGVCPP